MTDSVLDAVGALPRRYVPIRSRGLCSRGRRSGLEAEDVVRPHRPQSSRPGVHIRGRRPARPVTKPATMSIIPPLYGFPASSPTLSGGITVGFMAPNRARSSSCLNIQGRCGSTRSCSRSPPTRSIRPFIVQVHAMESIVSRFGSAPARPSVAVDLRQRRLGCRNGIRAPRFDTATSRPRVRVGYVPPSPWRDSTGALIVAGNAGPRRGRACLSLISMPHTRPGRAHRDRCHLLRRERSHADIERALAGTDGQLSQGRRGAAPPRPASSNRPRPFAPPRRRTPSSST